MDIQALLKQGVSLDVSDIHLSTGVIPFYRKDGELKKFSSYDILTASQALAILQNTLTEDQYNIFLEKKETDFILDFPEIGRFRGNAFFQAHGVGVALRRIPPQIPSLDNSEYPPILKEICSLKNGLVLVVGAAGSGKTTTLNACLNYINNRQSKNILTIEDPIEFIHTSENSLINQRQLHRDTDSFPNALRSALREDPDIIFVGEMRDLETIRLALTAAETGHLVFATLHTRSAPATVNRIIDVFPAEEKAIVRTILSYSLQAVISQTLIPLMQGKGRVAAMEIMLCNTAIRNLINESKIAQIYSVMQTHYHIGMQTLEQHLKQLISQNKIRDSILENYSL